jgi:xanthine dehydrogenase molybdenum-binding subunit
MCLQDGRVVNPSFVDYRMLTALDTPPITAIYIEKPDPTGSFGAKGLGEPPIIPPAPAIANAIFDATGIRVKEIPITAERLYYALSKKKLAEPSDQPDH